MLNAFLKDTAHPSRLLDEAEALLVVVGNDLGRRKGYAPLGDDLWFRRRFSDLRARHGLRSVAHGIAFRYPSLVMEWAFMGRLIALLIDEEPNGEFASTLALLTRRKPSFVVTANIDGSLRASGLDARVLFEYAGNLRAMTCRWNCDERTVSAESAVRTMLAPGRAPVIAPEHVPRCPRCGGPMEPAIARTHRFFHRADWGDRCCEMYAFLHRFRRKRLLVVELGVDPWSFELKGISAHAVQQNERARYIVASDDLGYLSPSAYDRTLHFQGEVADALAQLLEDIPPR